MARSFLADGQLSDTPRVRRKVLVTGAAGRIGSYFAQHVKDYDLRLMVHDGDESDPLEPVGDVVQGDVTNLDELKQAFAGIDTVIHLAADPSPSATWDSLLPVNITGTYNVFAAAKAAGCRRVVYASSIHAVSGYPPDRQVTTGDPPNPGDLYGVTKCFGEAMGRYMATQEGLSVICVRIGAFQPEEKMEQPDTLGLMDCFVSERDLTQLLCRCVDADELKFAIVHGLSESRFKRMDLTTTRELLGYAPDDNFTKENPRLADLHLDENVQSHSKRDGYKSGLREET